MLVHQLVDQGLILLLDAVHHGDERTVHLLKHLCLSSVVDASNPGYLADDLEQVCVFRAALLLNLLDESLGLVTLSVLLRDKVVDLCSQLDLLRLRASLVAQLDELGAHTLDLAVRPSDRLVELRELSAQADLRLHEVSQLALQVRLRQQLWVQ